MSKYLKYSKKNNVNHATIYQFRVIQSKVDLKNKSNIVSNDRGINQKRTENCIIASSTLLQ